MKNRINKIIDSLNGIKQVEPRPYFYSRLEGKMKSSNQIDMFDNKIEKPVFILTSILIIVLTVITLNFNELEEDNSNYTIEDLYFEDNESSIINLTSYEE
tara:strand:+ start:199 stop:498 length:300 start_codon:yes stop_codon:yes gene_type:complete